MKFLKTLFFALMLLPFGLLAKPTMAQFVDQLGDDHLKETYADFLKNPTRATCENFRQAFYGVPLSAPGSVMNRDAFAVYIEHVVFANYLFRIKLTKFSFPDTFKNKDGEITPWFLPVIVSGRNIISVPDLHVLKGDLTEMSNEPSNSEIALNQNFDNDFISFRFRYVQNPPRSSGSYKTYGEGKSVSSKFFEVSRYELIAKTMETGECEIEFYDKNLDASITVKFYNLPAIALFPLDRK